MRSYIALVFLVLVCMLIVDNGHGQQYRTRTIRRQTQRIVRNRNGELIRIVQTQPNNNSNRGNGNSNRGNNGNSNRRNNGNRGYGNSNRGNGNSNRQNGIQNPNGNGRIILGNPTRSQQTRQTSNQGRTNIIAIIVRNPGVESLLQQLAATIIDTLKRQDMMFFYAGVDTKETRSTRAMKAMFTGRSEKSMAMGEEERAKTAMVKEIAGQMNMSPQEAANSIDDLMKEFGIEVQGLGTRDDNCDQFVNDIQCDPTARYRTPDGTCNNLNKPLWGRAFIPMRRFQPAQYNDGVSEPRTKSVVGGDLPSARSVSLAVHESDSDARVLQAASHMLMQWGQFLDHDITSTPTATGEEGSNVGCCSDDVSGASLDRLDPDVRPENRDICFPINITGDDPRFRGRTCMGFVRSVQISNTNCQIAPAEQMNQITACIDGSSVYGSSQEEMDDLREFRGGLLRTGPNDLLPEDDHPSCLRTKSTDYCFKAGDARVNEQMGLATLHTVWMREHNRMARELNDLNPTWNDETLFQEARKIVGAKIQHITYNEFLPMLLQGSLRKQFDLRPISGIHPPNEVYKDNVDPSIRNAFATAAYRFGHSLVRTMFSQMDRGYQKMADLPLVSSFGNTGHLIDDNGAGVSRYVRGLVTDNAAFGDRLMTPMITQRLFEDGDGHSLDLAALNIQRGRDHGLPGYTTWRRWCNSRVPRTFDDLEKSHTKSTVAKLKSVYAHVDDIDLFAGGLSETAIKGTALGPTFACILAHQFKALKQGDRFFYETKNPVTGFTRAQIKTIKKTRLSQVLCDNTDIEFMQPRAFRRLGTENERVTCLNQRQESLFAWSDDPDVRRQANQTPNDRSKGTGGKTVTNPPFGTSVWGEWSDFGRCQDGKRWRQRACVSFPVNAVPTCVGPSSESETCSSGGVDCSKSIYDIFSRYLCNK